MKEQKSLYVVFLMTDTAMGKIIRIVTRHEYNHVTLSFCPGLCKMFSFARYKKDSPFVGGFVCERTSRYLFPNRDAKVKICRLPIKESEYETLKKRIAGFTRDGRKMLYNSLGALMMPLGIDVNIKYAYTCLGFVCETLGMSAGSIKELEEILKKYVIYEGNLKKYLKKYDLSGLGYFNPIPLHKSALDTAKHFGVLVKRLLD